MGSSSVFWLFQLLAQLRDAFVLSEHQASTSPDAALSRAFGEYFAECGSHTASGEYFA